MVRPNPDSKLEYIDINEGIDDDDDDDEAFDYEAEDPAPQRLSSTNVGRARPAAALPTVATSISPMMCSERSLVRDAEKVAAMVVRKVANQTAKSHCQHRRPKTKFCSRQRERERERERGARAAYQVRSTAT